jgi:hypothetical protein
VRTRERQSKKAKLPPFLIFSISWIENKKKFAVILEKAVIEFHMILLTKKNDFDEMTNSKKGKKWLKIENKSQ